MDKKFKKRPRYKLRHLYEFLEIITGKDRKAIRKKMLRMKLGNDYHDFSQYLEYFYKKKFKIKDSNKNQETTG